MTLTTVVAGHSATRTSVASGPPLRPWRWTSVLLASVELLAVVWSLPFVILLIGIPIALAVALVHWVGRYALSLF